MVNAAVNKHVASLEDIAVNMLLSAVNIQEAAKSLWEKEGFVPTLIERRSKLAKSSLEKLIFCFHPIILEKLWGCPQEYLTKYSCNENVDYLLDSIIYGRPNIWTLPMAVIELLDKRDKEICETVKYLKFFNVRRFKRQSLRCKIRN